MKTIIQKTSFLAILCMAFSLSINAQLDDVSGSYKCSFVSYCNKVNPTDNYKKEASYNILIHYNEAQPTKGYIVIQNVDDPKNIDIHLVKSKMIEIPPFSFCNANYLLTTYLSGYKDALFEVVIYFDKENDINLMINEGEQSIAFKDLVKVSK